jgi:hypothetical protein
MKLGRMAAIAFAVTAMGFVLGSAMAMVAAPSAIPTTPPAAPMVSYTIQSPAPGAPELFTPFYAVTHLGLVQVKIVSTDVYPHLYILRGMGIMINVPPHATITMLAYLTQPGQFAWINEMPTPGSPIGMTVGFLTVT